MKFVISGTAIALISVLPCVLNAQDGPGAIRGSVTDRASATPLPVTVVRIRETHATEVAHQDGSFRFDALRAGRYTVVGERIGYATDSVLVDVRAGQTAVVELKLAVAAIQLAQVTVTGSLRPQAARDLTSSASSVSGAALDRKLDATVAATLRNEPGVAVGGIGPATARPVIRGLGGNRILMLEDGQRPGDMSSTSADHAVAIEPLTAQRLEVVRGPLSLMYGSSALGGVANVIRDEIPRSIPEDAHGSFLSQVSSVNRGVSAGGHTTLALAGVGLRGEGSYRKSGDVRVPGSSLENTSAETLTGAFAGGVANDVGHVGGSYRFYANDYGIPGGFVGGHESGVDIEMRRHTFRLAGELHPSDVTQTRKLQVDALYSDYHHDEIGAGGTIGTRFDQKVLSGEVRAQHDTLWLATNGAIGVRAEYRDIQTGGSLDTPSTSDLTFAGYVVEEFGRGPLRVQLGARYDWALFQPELGASITTSEGEIPVRERTFGSFSGSAGVVYAPSESWRIGSSLSRAYRTPDFNELYSDGPHLAANSYDVGDPGLDEEIGLGAELFVRFNTERFSGEAAVFRNQLDNYIFPSSRGRVERGPQRGRPRLQFTNEDARFSGVEGSVEWSVHRRWVLEANASYVGAEFTSERADIPIFENQDTVLLEPSRYPPLIPPLHGRAGARYETPRYFGGIDVTWAARQERTGDFETPTGAYAVPGANAGVRLSRGGMFHTVTLRIDNMLDHEYRDHLSRIKDFMPEPGRNISLLYRLTY